MWAVLVAMVVAGPRPAARPLVHRRADLRLTVGQRVVRMAPEIVRKVETPEGTLARVLSGFELNGPVVLKPDFQGGPGAAIALKF